MKDYVVLDMETNGKTLEEVTKVHVIRWQNITKNTWGYFTGRQYTLVRDFINDPNLVFIGHNVIFYDFPVILKIFQVKPVNQVLDTLPIARATYPKRMEGTFGLAYFGEDYGIPKPVVTDWKDQPFSVYFDRCTEDVRINTRLFKEIVNKLLKIYQNWDEVLRYMNFLSFKTDMIELQHQSKWKLDVPTCGENYNQLVQDILEREDVLRATMPQPTKPKKLSKPKNCYTVKGELSVAGKKWLQHLKQYGYPQDRIDPIHVKVPTKVAPNPGSHDQVKNWLYSLGWIPETFDYKKEKDESTKRVPQITIKNSGGKLCESITVLEEVEPNISQLAGFFILKHRATVLKGFLNNVDEQGFLTATVNGFTNTLRFKHKVLVNLPKEDRIRGCLVAKEGHVLCGWDMAALEDKTKQHYIYPYDPEYVKTMNISGFDPHLDLGEIIGIVTKKESDRYKYLDKKDDEGRLKDEDKPEYRSIKKKRMVTKVCNYSCTYGAGAPSISRTAKISLQEAKVAHAGYWKRNWAIKAVASGVSVKLVDGEYWLYNPVSRFWYWLKYEKDKFSTLNQSTGAYCFDLTTFFVSLQRKQATGQFHDEQINELVDTEEEREKMKNILNNAINKVNSVLQLKVTLSIGIKFGYDYSKIH